jgi:hypothetical protein
LDNHLEKLLEYIFISKSLFLVIKKYIESLLELLSAMFQLEVKNIQLEHKNFSNEYSSTI